MSGKSADRNRNTVLKRLLAGIAAALVLLCGLFAPGLATRAYARSYEIGRVVVEAGVFEDGTVEVVEDRTFEFDGDFNGV